jgi:phage shock protein A
MGLFDRISRVLRANVNTAVSAAEDPEKILEQTVLDMQEDQVKLRQAVAQAIASQKRLEQQYNQNQTQVNEWDARARLALQKGDEGLAREALNRKKTYAETAGSLKTQLDNSVTQVETLKRNMTALESKIAEAKTKKDMLVARAKAAKASEQITQAMGQVDTSGALAAFDKMETKVLEMEARSEAYAELAGDNLESQFAALESATVDEDLLRLKAEMSGGGSLPPASQASGALPPSVAVETDPELEALRREIERA